MMRSPSDPLRPQPAPERDGGRTSSLESTARQLGGFKFRRQHQIGSYVCDFICLEAVVIVELDGSHHLDQAPYDLHRDAFLRRRGFRILRFWNVDVMAGIENVTETIFEALHRRDMDGRFD